MKPKSLRLGIAFVAALLFFLVLIVIPAISAYRSLDMMAHPAIKKNTATPEKFNLEFEDVDIEVEGGTLSGWWIGARREQSPVVILVHGLGSNKRNMMPMVRLIRKHGYHILAYDARGHGDSIPGPVTFGAQESDDLLRVVDFAAEKGGVERVGIYGFSLGATTALLAASKNSERIAAIVSEGAFADTCALVTRMTGKDKGGFNSLVRPFIGLEAKLFFDIEGDLLNAVKNIEIPVLLIHGERDAVVSVDEARALDEALTCRHKLWIVPRGSHGDAYALEPLQYQFDVVMFFNKSIGHLAELVDGDPFRPATATPPQASVGEAINPPAQAAPVAE
jgi:uncharacterized protein